MWVFSASPRTFLVWASGSLVLNTTIVEALFPAGVQL